MSKPSHRPNREEIKRQRRERKEAQKALRRRQRSEGLETPPQVSLANRKCDFKSLEEEREARMDAVGEQLRVLRSQWPVLLKRLSGIRDPRNVKKVKYRLTLLMIYGILSFVYQMASRREANREMTRPVFMENLNRLFPELETLPHHDTLMRLLSKIEVNQIERCHMDLVREMIRKKKFSRYLIRGYYPIAIDGTQKFALDILWSEECLEREVRRGDDLEAQYYVYVLEANLVFRNGMSLPLMSEFLSYTEGDTEADRQDCELRAIRRLVKRLKAEFPRLAILLLLDGLYPNGPLIELCRKNHWQFMIVLQDTSLPSVWEEYEGLRKLEPKKNHLHRTWGNRRQHFQWVNDIEYFYGPNGGKKQIVHVVVCEECWEEVAENSQVVTKRSRHAWISSEPLDKWNVHERCNLSARHRWGIESGFLVEKRQGYQYEHCFSYNWNAMKGYHYLMRLGHLFNVLSQYSEALVERIKEMGMRGFIRFIRETLSGPWFDSSWGQEDLKVPVQLRLI